MDLEANLAKSVIIISQTADMHAHSVGLVLDKLGIKTHQVNSDAIMISNKLSFDYDSAQGVRLQLFGFHGSVDEISAVWNRRIARPFSYHVPSSLTRADEQYVKKNYAHCLDGFLSLFDEIFTVNPTTTLYASASKVRQLKWAMFYGLNVPETLISNNSSEIRSFFSKYQDVCVKPFTSYSWRTETGIAVTNTSILSSTDIDDTDALEIMPHIYQRFVPKKNEYRLTMFGNYSVVTKIRTSKLDDGARIDWRSSAEYLSLLEPATIDDRIISKCKLLLLKLELRFGTIDLAEDFEGNIYFLEVNPAGQWLWQENHCPECIVLEPFARFLASGNDNFTWNASLHNREFHAHAIIKEVEEGDAYKDAITLGNTKPLTAYQADERNAT